ncbi:hypothetical protein NPIL_184241, partial [Nephila pilipes]
ETMTAFDSSKKLVIDPIALSLPAPNARLSLMADASDFEVGPALQQHIGSAVEPLSCYKTLRYRKTI